MKRNVVVTILAGLTMAAVTGLLVAVDASQSAIAFVMFSALVIVALASAWATSPPVPTIAELEKLEQSKSRRRREAADVGAAR